MCNKIILGTILFIWKYLTFVLLTRLFRNSKMFCYLAVFYFYILFWYDVGRGSFWTHFFILNIYMTFYYPLLLFSQCSRSHKLRIPRKVLLRMIAWKVTKILTLIAKAHVLSYNGSLFKPFYTFLYGYTFSILLLLQHVKMEQLWHILRTQGLLHQ